METRLVSRWGPRVVYAVAGVLVLAAGLGVWYYGLRAPAPEEVCRKAVKLLREHRARPPTLWTIQPPSSVHDERPPPGLSAAQQCVWLYEVYKRNWSFWKYASHARCSADAEDPYELVSCDHR